MGPRFPILLVDHMGEPGLPDLAIVCPVDPAQFEADMELIAAQIGKRMAECQ